MKINADIYVKDVPGTLVSSLEPISTLGGNIVGVVHNREQIVSGRISVNVIFNMEQSSLDALKKEWKARDIIIADFGEDFGFADFFMAISARIGGNKRMNRNKTIRTLFALFCVLVLTFSLAATAFADGDPIAVVNKLSDFIADEAKKANLTFIMGVN